MVNNLQRKAFSYTSCTDLYGSPKSDPNRALTLFIYNLYQTARPHRTLYNRSMTLRPLMDVQQSMANNLQRKAFLYTSCTDLYGSPKSDPNSPIRLCLCRKYTKLGGPVVPCTPGVRIPDRLRMFTRPWQTICSERHFRTPPVRICTAPRSRTRTAQLGCVCTNYKKLVGPVVPCTPGVRLPDRSRMFTRWFTAICNE